MSLIPTAKLIQRGEEGLRVLRLKLFGWTPKSTTGLLEKVRIDALLVLVHELRQLLDTLAHFAHAHVLQVLKI